MDQTNRAIAEIAFRVGLTTAGLDYSIASMIVENTFDIEHYAPYDSIEAHRLRGYEIGRLLVQIDDSPELVTQAQKTELTKNMSNAVVESMTDESKRGVDVIKGIDPSDDGDLEVTDAFNWSDEIEILFEGEAMSPSFELIQSDTDIYELDIISPSGIIDVSSEIDQEEQVSSEDETSADEEAIPFEREFYPDLDDQDYELTDQAEELFLDVQEFDYSDAIEDQISLSEQVIDDMQAEGDANLFDSIAETFHQDDSLPFLADGLLALNDDFDMDIIDIPSLRDDTAALVIDFATTDDFNIPFFDFLDDDPILGENPFDFV